MRTLTAVCVLSFVLAGAALAGSPLDVFVPFCGKTWQGTFSGQDGTAMTDVARWEMILGGKAVRSVHSLNDGVYGGESLIYWDEAAQQLAFVYVTTAGFRTDGTMTIDGDAFISEEVVTGDAGGVTKVRSTARILADGTMTVVSEYRRDGAWEPGHTITYVEAPDAEVVFK
jgi:hypothetical protein